MESPGDNLHRDRAYTSFFANWLHEMLQEKHWFGNVKLLNPDDPSSDVIVNLRLTRLPFTSVRADEIEVGDKILWENEDPVYPSTHCRPPYERWSIVTSAEPSISDPTKILVEGKIPDTDLMFAHFITPEKMVKIVHRYMGHRTQPDKPAIVENPQ